MKSHPRCEVGHPPWQLWALAVGVSGGAALLGLLGALWALSEGAPNEAVIAALIAFAGAAIFPRTLGRFSPLWTFRREGRKCFAVSDEAMILVDARGTAVEVDLDRIVALEIDGTEPRLRIDDDEQQGFVYAALFDVFDGQGPSPEAFFVALESRLRARIPGAQIVRRSDLALF